MKKGFTLVELLVVVLIIGILSSVALPQYQKSLEKARYAEALPTLKAIFDAGKLYRTTFRANPTTLNDLDVKVAEQGRYFTYGIDSGNPCSKVDSSQPYSSAIAFRKDSRYILRYCDGFLSCEGSYCQTLGYKIQTTSCLSSTCYVHD